ncbi:Rpn family recombination-promoting nuclease/putative transposase [Enterococcus hulanensis]|uniref:Rpn family recombination-promoting nuclease/putative transposase n=1 Tax=Enterococcus TaxID=1350 RepID=UPI000B5AB386|nr:MULTISPECIES: Rpn family recombination-promoting nuclease/putative transposase [Enterococcus]MBO0413129.1 Rpn family recombination-promoting nuclease/putative transposase [Enterococcus hulanensis]
MQKFLPTNDLLFKKLLTSEDSSSILRAFVKDLLGIEFQTLTPKETYHIDSYKKAFEEMDILRTEVDILAIGEDGSHTTLECQIQPHAYFRERSIFYLAEAFCSPFGNLETNDFIRDNNFSALRPAYGINIVDFHLFDQKQDALQLFRLLNEQTNQPFLGTNRKELLLLCFLSLKNNNRKSQSAIHHWQHFLKTGETLANAPDYIKKAKQKVDYYSLGSEEKEMIMKINKSKAINDAVISTARMEGIEEGIDLGIEQGIEQGAKQEKRKFALRLLKMNFPIEKIVEATELDSETIKKIESEHK